MEITKSSIERCFFMPRYKEDMTLDGSFFLADVGKGKGDILLRMHDYVVMPKEEFRRLKEKAGEPVEEEE